MIVQILAKAAGRGIGRNPQGVSRAAEKGGWEPLRPVSPVTFVRTGDDRSERMKAAPIATQSNFLMPVPL
jgi:hypothetical protein